MQCASLSAVCMLSSSRDSLPRQLPITLPELFELAADDGVEKPEERPFALGDFVPDLNQCKQPEPVQTFVSGKLSALAKNTVDTLVGYLQIKAAQYGRKLTVPTVYVNYSLLEAESVDPDLCFYLQMTAQLMSLDDNWKTSVADELDRALEVLSVCHDFLELDDLLPVAVKDAISLRTKENDDVQKEETGDETSEKMDKTVWLEPVERDDLFLITNCQEGYPDAIKRILEENQGLNFNLDALETLYQRPELLTRYDYITSLLKALTSVIKMVDIRVADTYYRLLEACLDNLSAEDCDRALNFYYETYGDKSESDTGIFVPAFNEKSRNEELFDTIIPDLIDEIGKLDGSEADAVRTKLLKSVTMACLLSSRVASIRLLTKVRDADSDSARNSLVQLLTALRSFSMVQVRDKDASSVRPLQTAAVFRLCEAKQTNHEALSALLRVLCVAQENSPPVIDVVKFVNESVVPYLRVSSSPLLLSCLADLFNDAQIHFELQLTAPEVDVWQGGDATQAKDLLNAPDLVLLLSKQMSSYPSEALKAITALSHCFKRKNVAFASETLEWLTQRLDTTDKLLAFYLPQLCQGFGTLWQPRIPSCVAVHLDAPTVAKYAQIDCNSKPDRAGVIKCDKDHNNTDCVLDTLFSLIVAPEIARDAVNSLVENLNFVLRDEHKGKIETRLVKTLPQLQSATDWEAAWDLLKKLIDDEDLPDKFRNEDIQENWKTFTKRSTVADCLCMFTNAVELSVVDEENGLGMAKLDQCLNNYRQFMREKCSSLTDLDWAPVAKSVRRLASVLRFKAKAPSPEPEQNMNADMWSTVGESLKPPTATTPMACYNCNETGHKARFCPKNREQRREPAAKPDNPNYKCPYCHALGQHFGRNCPENRCRNCSQLGHFAKECPQNMKCTKCSKTGHFARDCPVVNDPKYQCRKCGVRGEHFTHHCSRNVVDTSLPENDAVTDVSKESVTPPEEPKEQPQPAVNLCPKCSLEHGGECKECRKCEQFGHKALNCPLNQQQVPDHDIEVDDSVAMPPPSRPFGAPPMVMHPRLPGNLAPPSSSPTPLNTQAQPFVPGVPPIVLPPPQAFQTQPSNTSSPVPGAHFDISQPPMLNALFGRASAPVLQQPDTTRPPPEIPESVKSQDSQPDTSEWVENQTEQTDFSANPTGMAGVGGVGRGTVTQPAPGMAGGDSVVMTSSGVGRGKPVMQSQDVRNAPPCEKDMNWRSRPTDPVHRGAALASKNVSSHHESQRHGPVRDRPGPVGCPECGGFDHAAGHCSKFANWECYGCNQYGHMRKYCPEQHGPVGHRQFDSTHRHGGSGCFTCGEFGHRNIDCPVRQSRPSGAESTASMGQTQRGMGPKCYNCNEMGHLSRNCPQKSRPSSDEYVTKQESEPPSTEANCSADVGEEYKNNKRPPTTVRECEEIGHMASANPKLEKQQHDKSKKGHKTGGEGARWGNGRGQGFWNGNRKHCSHCNLDGHTKEECHGGRPKLIKKCEYCRNPGHTVDECRKKKKALLTEQGIEHCRICGETDHAVDSCPLLYCNHCETQGLHSSSRCPDKGPRGYYNYR